MTESDRPRTLTLADLGAPSWHRSTRLTAYLLRALVWRVRDAVTDEYRLTRLPEELSTAIRGEHRDGMWCESWIDRLAERWGISLAGDDATPYALAARTPEGWVPWVVACRAIRRTDLAQLVAEWGSYLATFATSKPSEDDEELLRIELPPEVSNPWRAAMPSNPVIPHRHVAVLTLTAPLHHGADEKDGNVSRFRTERRYNGLLGRSVEVPFISGNAWRGQVRDLVAQDLFDTIGMEAREAAPAMANALFSGGSIESGSASSGANVAMRRALRGLLPIVDLLGGVYGNEPMDGVLRATDLLPICRETADTVVYLVAPEIAAQGDDAVRAWAERLPWAEDLYETRQLTRHAHRDLESDGVQMLVRTEVIRAGTQWVHAASLACKDRMLSPLTRSAFARALDLFVQSGAIGAGNARGLGAFVTDGYGDAGDSAPYLDHLRANAEQIRDVLRGVVSLGAGAPKPEKPTKASRGKGAKAPPIAPPEEISFEEPAAP